MRAPSRYGIKDQKTGEGVIQLAHATTELNEIVFSTGARGIYGEYLSAVFHESAHLKDWQSNKALTLEERMNLAQEVIDRVNSPDRFRSAYVELINNPDKQKELRIKAEEYYAEITRAYFDRSHFFLPQRDRHIIEQMIHETDPAFTERDGENVGDKIEELVSAKFHTDMPDDK